MRDFDKAQVTLVVRVIMGAAFSVVESSVQTMIDDRKVSHENIANLAAHTTAQAGEALAALYYQITDNPMAVTDATGYYIRGKWGTLETTLHEHADQLSRHKNNPRPDTDEMDKLWVGDLFDNYIL